MATASKAIFTSSLCWLSHVVEEFSLRHWYFHFNLQVFANIYVEDLMAVGVENGTAELHPRKYSVVRKDQSYCGEIQVGVTFT
nr:isoform 2 of elicitor-responsive protein 1 [Quercus suber]